MLNYSGCICKPQISNLKSQIKILPLYHNSLTEMEKTKHFAASVGFFDGVHRGHQFLIERLRLVAEERGLDSMIVTFAQHPRQVLQKDWHPRLLSTLNEKRSRLLMTGIDRLEVLEFDLGMSRLSAREFMEQVLRKQLNVRTLLTGYDNRFGHGRKECFEDYVAYGREMGVEVLCADALVAEGLPLQGRISSSYIRTLLEEGKADEAQVCLGYPYEMSGHVVQGEMIGRHLGFPTANLLPDDPSKLVPGNGVYAVKVLIEGRYEVYNGITNIGMRPTFDGHQTTIETHLLDFDGNIYDHRMTIRLLTRLRDERQFPDRESLVRQMEEDKTRAMKILKTD